VVEPSTVPYPMASTFPMNPEKPRRRRLLGGGIVLILVGGCDLGSGPSPVPASLEAVAGVDQVVTVWTPVPVSPAVRVLGKKGKPISGVEVVFSVVSGGGQLSGPAAIPDKGGVAGVGTWILGTTAGAQTLQARVAELPPFFFFGNCDPCGSGHRHPQRGEFPDRYRWIDPGRSTVRSGPGRLREPRRGNHGSV